MKKLSTSLAAITIVGLTATHAAASTISFTTSDYDNTANTVTAGPTTNNNQTSGMFRDVFWWSINNGLPRVGSADYINQGNSLVLESNHAVPGPGPVTALNFTGPSIAGGQSYLAILDDLASTGPSLFDASIPGGLEISADVLFVKHNSAAGVVALYGDGQDGLALLANNRDGNNTDNSYLSLVFQSNGVGIQLANVSLPSGSFCTATDGGVGCTPGDHWYRVVMNLFVTSPDVFTVTGAFYNHATAGDPTSGLGSQIASLTFNGSLLNSDPGALRLTNPGEIGVIAQGRESISLPDNVGVSITNFTYPDDRRIDAAVPEPGSMLLLGSGLLGLTRLRRKKRQS